MIDQFTKTGSGQNVGHHSQATCFLTYSVEPRGPHACAEWWVHHTKHRHGMVRQPSAARCCVILAVLLCGLAAPTGAGNASHFCTQSDQVTKTSSGRHRKKLRKRALFPHRTTSSEQSRPCARRLQLPLTRTGPTLVAARGTCRARSRAQCTGERAPPRLRCSSRASSWVICSYSRGETRTESA